MGMQASPYFKKGDDVENKLITVGSIVENVPKRGPLLKQQDLPQSVKWTGTSNSSFENFLHLFKSHVGQQQHISYILIPSFQQLWFQWGKPAWVLGSARKKLAFLTQLHHHRTT